MSSVEAVPAAGPRLHRFSAWFDPETAGVVLSVPLAGSTTSLPKLFILPLVLGVLIVTGGSLTMANEKNPSRQLLRGCACSNVVSLLGALLAFCLYCYILSIMKNDDVCIPNPTEHYYLSSFNICPGEILLAYKWSLILLLLLYDMGAVVLHGLLCVSALKALKTD
ncbi:Hypothetical protein SMAX5B_004895 [Scophthalmus maximus]|uniref:Uncharacterized protein n=1 Tax=Scophthalmus maximus TaxID=52904 RepID=A0A2U9BQH9_SCOMX|nr:Hypothetical protein SMAX5B_004895 [Scophthalmus maximus]